MILKPFGRNYFSSFKRLAIDGELLNPTLPTAAQKVAATDEGLVVVRSLKMTKVPQPGRLANFVTKQHAALMLGKSEFSGSPTGIHHETACANFMFILGLTSGSQKIAFAPYSAPSWRSTASGDR